MNFSARLVTALSAGLVLFFATVFPGIAQAQQSGNPVLVLETSMGDITIELFKEKAPESAKNFLAYAKAGFYNNTIFHRAIKGFVIQFGGVTPTLQQKRARPPIKNESNNGVLNKPGTLSMARHGDPNSATSHVFINTGNNTNLDFKAPDKWGYSVFGKVIDGMSVVTKIENMKTTTKGVYADIPAETVTIKTVRVKS
jgi:cyclophilin family peptidyl-prolyl cis-trans isomerase